MEVEFRQHRRHRIYTLAYFTLNGAVAGILVDIGQGGMAVQSNLPLAPGTTRQVAFLLSATQRVECNARIVWTGGNGRAGLEFCGLSEESALQLAQWLPQAGGPLKTNPMSTEVAESPACLDALALMDERAPRNINSLAAVLLAIFVFGAVTALAGVIWMRHKDLGPEAARAAASPAAAVGLKTLVATPITSPRLPHTHTRRRDLQPEPRTSRPQVKDVRYVADAKAVVIDLSGTCRYQAHRLHRPERIYIDFYDADAAPTVAGGISEASGGLLRSVRVGRPSPKFTRIVLDTERPVEYRASLVQRPSRLVVEIRGE
jgi:hypothetical protein